MRGGLVVTLIRWGTGGKPPTVLIRREDGTQVVRPFRGLRRDLQRDDYHSTSGGNEASACDGAVFSCLSARGNNAWNVANRVWSLIH